jgi:serine/threonine protein kinase
MIIDTTKYNGMDTLPSPLYTPQLGEPISKKQKIYHAPEVLPPLPQPDNPQKKQFKLLKWALNNNEKISKYTPIKILGFGASGVVFEAICGRQKRAIKVIKKSDNDPKEVLLLGLNHKNIVKLYEYFQDSKASYLIMESFGTIWRMEHTRKTFSDDISTAYDDSERGTSSTLFEFIDFNGCGRVPSRSQKPLFFQIASAVDYLHSLNIVHGDLKEENVLIEKRNGRLTAKLCDFGHAIKVGDVPEMKSYGTKVLSAPELLLMLKMKQNKVPCHDLYFGFKQDIWALGMLFYTMLNGFLPPENDDFVQSKYDLYTMVEYPTDFEVIKDKGEFYLT